VGLEGVGKVGKKICIVRTELPTKKTEEPNGVNSIIKRGQLTGKKQEG